MSESRGRPGHGTPALAYCLLHVPLYLALFAPAIADAVRLTPEPFRPAVWPIFVPGAIFLALAAWALSLPLAPFPRLYRVAAPALAGLFTVGILLDARVYEATRFHLNGFFLRVALQPNALAEVGIPGSVVAGFLATAAAIVVAEVVVGAWFLRRFARPAGRPWRLALALVLLVAAERVYGAVLVVFGGQAVAEASQTLPLQVPLSMQKLVMRALGRSVKDPYADERASKRLPPLLPVEQVKITRTPDVVLALAESLPATHFDAATMPRMWARSEQGSRFDLHVAAASGTNHTVFSIVYGLQATKLSATVGSGRRPLLFEALAHAGYDVQVLSSSCVDWMDLKTTVFASVPVETWCDDAPDRDALLLARAHELIQRSDPSRPYFLFVFLYGTHFKYVRDAEDVVHVPEWDGQGDFTGSKASSEAIRNRARNAAHALDRKLDGLLAEVAEHRGREPIVLFTGDHGEEFREKGHLGHGSDVTREQIQVPAFIAGPGIPRGVHALPTGHADIAPTLLSLLGDENPPSRWSDGISMLDVERYPDRFVLSTVGWEPRHALVGRDLKVRMLAGAGSQITDLDDRPLADGDALAGRRAAEILRALRGPAGEGGAAPGGPAAGPAGGTTVPAAQAGGGK
ncbi:MAG: sulfatase-like hydrolase/transferase [Anaeromyxobacter sp.]